MNLHLLRKGMRTVMLKLMAEIFDFGLVIFFIVYLKSSICVCTLPFRIVILCMDTFTVRTGSENKSILKNRSQN